MDLKLSLVIIGAVFIVVIAAGLLAQYLKRKGVDVDAALEKMKKTLDNVSGICETLLPFLTDSQGEAAVEKLLDLACVAVANAEQLYHVGSLKPDERKDAARTYVKEALELVGIKVTPQIERLIDGAIEAEVLELGHKAVKKVSATQKG